MPPTLASDLDTQIDRLVSLGWPALAGVPEAAFRERLAPLRAVSVTDPYVVVVTRRLVDPSVVVPTLELRGKPGFTSVEPSDLDGFRPLPELGVPDVDAYLLVGVDPGPDTLNVPPRQALPGIVASGRSPLTVEDGIAVVAQDPTVLSEQNCFSMAGSRCGDKRVPTLWLSARRPRLGWCWEGAPHTWLGTASCTGRVW